MPPPSTPAAQSIVDSAVGYGERVLGGIGDGLVVSFDGATLKLWQITVSGAALIASHSLDDAPGYRLRWDALDGVVVVVFDGTEGEAALVVITAGSPWTVVDYRGGSTWASVPWDDSGPGGYLGRVMISGDLQQVVIGTVDGSDYGDHVYAYDLADGAAAWDCAMNPGWDNAYLLAAPTSDRWLRWGQQDGTDIVELCDTSGTQLAYVEREDAWRDTWCMVSENTAMYAWADATTDPIPLYYRLLDCAGDTLAWVAAESSIDTAWEWSPAVARAIPVLAPWFGQVAVGYRAGTTS